MERSVVLLGAGGIGETHLKALSRTAGLRAAAVADIQFERAARLAETYGLKPYADYGEMLAEQKPDIAIVALPHFLHREAAVRCLEAGCHLLLEKPMAMTAAECDEIVEHAERRGLIVLVGHTQQYLPHNRAAKALMLAERASLGKLVQINDVRYGPYFTPNRPRWFLDRAKSGGGIVANLGAHAIDKIQWLTDSRIRRVRARLSFEAPDYPDIEGSAAMLFETDSGVACTVSLGGYEGVWRQETDLLFTGGMIRIRSHEGLWIARRGQCEEVPVEKGEDPYMLQLSDLAECIRRNAQPYAWARYGRSVVRVIEAVYASHASGREVDVGD